MRICNIYHVYYSVRNFNIFIENFIEHINFGVFSLYDVKYRAVSGENAASP